MINMKSVPYKEMYYIRQEGAAYRLISSLGYDFSKIINYTAKDILDQIDGRNNLEDILSFMKLKYNSVDMMVLKEDLLETIINLMKSKIINLKIIDGEKMNMEDKIIYLDNDMNLQIKKLNELDLMQMYNFTKLKSNKKIINDNIENDYSEIVLRNAFFTYNEEFYGIFIKNKLCGIISFKRKMTKYGNFFINGILVYDDQLNDYDLNIVITKASQNLYEDEEYNCKKIRFSFLETKDSMTSNLLLLY